MNEKIDPVVKTKMLFRVPVDRLFESIVNPEITTRFWFTHSSGPLVAGEMVTWEWRMFGVATRVEVLQIEPSQKVVMTWGESGKRSTVEWDFTKHGESASVLEVTTYGFSGTDEAIINEAIDVSGGFALVLANAKAWLEHGIELQLIADRFPAEPA